MNLEVPESVVLNDGTKGILRGVAATIADGKFVTIVYTVEKENGAWQEVAADASWMQVSGLAEDAAENRVADEASQPVGMGRR